MDGPERATPLEAFDRLLSGNQRFVAGESHHGSGLDLAGFWYDLARGTVEVVVAPEMT